MTYSADDKVEIVKGIGSQTASKLEKLGISTIGDILNHIPRRYIDFTTKSDITTLKEKQPASVLAKISYPKSFYAKTGKMVTQATATDSTGSISLTWFNNPYIKKLIEPDIEYSIAGVPSRFGNKLTIISPVIEKGDSFTLNTSGLVPVYPLTEGITSKWLRKKIFEILKDINLKDPIPPKILNNNNLLTLSDAIKQIHFPSTEKHRLEADKRLSYNEHLKINIQNTIENLSLGGSVGCKINQDLHKKMAEKLPFKLTRSQESVLDNIYKDIKRSKYTHRLIQGETGSGKTAPLLFATGQVLNAGLCSAILAPTEILANQHYQTFKKYFIFPDRVKLVTASSKEVVSNSPTVYIGTHAILNRLGNNMEPSLGLLAIDEQHKFGVGQRELLIRRSPLPHVLNLSATPIPRTVALGLLGDLKISTIKTKPNNQLPIKTYIVTSSKFIDSPKWLKSELSKGSLLYAVCPSIFENSNTASVETHTKLYRKLLDDKFPIFSIHGKMTSEEQSITLEKFKSSDGGVLVATSLIEVGIDIPNANIMVIHSADRFGLAQLHQLRGRVGRGSGQAYCFLVPENDDDMEKERLLLLKKYDNGLTLAQKDLRLRGAGDIYGLKQHGRLATRLKYFWSKKLFQASRKDAERMVHEQGNQASEIASRLVTW